MRDNVYPVQRVGRPLTAVRDVTETRRMDGLAAVAMAAAGAEQARHGRQLDMIVTSMFSVGLGLQAAMDKPAEAAGQHIAEALRDLDEAIRRIRDIAFSSGLSRGQGPGR